MTVETLRDMLCPATGFGARDHPCWFRAQGKQETQRQASGAAVSLACTRLFSSAPYPGLEATIAHNMTAPPVCGGLPLQGPVVQQKPWHLLEVTPIPGDQRHILHQRRRRNAKIATAHAQPHRT